MSRNLCANNGVLVPPSGLLGPETFDFESTELAATVVGCNQLMCSRCGQFVRERSGFATGSEGFLAAQPELRLRDDWRPFVESGAVQVTNEVRLYLCGCTAFDAGSTYRLDEIDDLRTMPPWKCAGHPLMALPTKCDGVMFFERMDVSSLVRSYFAGELDREPGVARWGIDWLNRIFVALGDVALATRIAEGVAQLAESEEPRLAVRSFTFFETHPRRSEADRLLAVYQSRRDFLRSQLNPMRAGRTLDVWLIRALAARLKATQATVIPIRDFFRELALGPEPVPQVALDALAVFDASFFEANRAALQLANPTIRRS